MCIAYRALILLVSAGLLSASVQAVAPGRDWSKSSFGDPRHPTRESIFLVHSIASAERLPKDTRIGASFPAIFASVVGSTKYNTYSTGYGYILEISPHHLVGAVPHDTGIQIPRKIREGGSSSAADLEQDWGRTTDRYFKTYGASKLTPRELLSRTEPNEHNEALLRGSVDNDVVLISGIFFKSGSILDEDRASLAKLRAFAAKNGLPIVDLDSIHP